MSLVFNQNIIKSTQRFLKSTRFFSSLGVSIDCHTHMYTPRYMDILRSRTDIPRVVEVNNQSRLIILPGEDKENTTSSGRVIGREYWDVSAKIQFMDNHRIQTSIVSLANPWLDFLSGLVCYFEVYYNECQWYISYDKR